MYFKLFEYIYIFLRNVIQDLQVENQVSVLAVRKKWNSLLNKFKVIVYYSYICYLLECFPTIF